MRFTPVWLLRDHHYSSSGLLYHAARVLLNGLPGCLCSVIFGGPQILRGGCRGHPLVCFVYLTWVIFILFTGSVLVFSAFHGALLYVSVLFMLSRSVLLPLQLAFYHLAEHQSANSVKWPLCDLSRVRFTQFTYKARSLLQYLPSPTPRPTL